MERSTKQRNFFIILFISVLLLGIFFRCYNLDKKVYWHDEVFTSVRTAGYNGQEIVANSFNNTVIKPNQLLQYQTLNSHKNWNDTLDKLIEHPEHPPLYYLLSRTWQQTFGSSITATRSLSVIFSLLIFPAIYWFCWELFNSKKVGLWTVGIISISPLQVLYAQEAREYTLLALMTVISCTALAGAVKRKNKWLWWGLYAISTAINFYVSLVAIYIGISQAVYVLILEKFNLSKIATNFIISFLISLVLFLPWVWIIQSNFLLLKQKTAWSNQPRPFNELLIYWQFHLNSIFIDLFPKINRDIIPHIFIVLVIFIFICYRFVCFRTQVNTWLLLVILATVPVSIIILPDVINGGIKSINTRYFLPSLLIVQIVVGYWLSHIKTCRDFKRSISLFLILFFGISSCLISSGSDTWWNKGVGKNNPKFATAINSYQKPLVISNAFNTNVGVIISLAHLLDNKVDLVLFDENIPVVNSSDYSHVLLYSLREKDRIQFQEKNNCELEKIQVGNYSYLWQMKN